MLETPLSTLRQTDEGTWLIGDSQEEAGYVDNLVGLPILGTLADRAVRISAAFENTAAVGGAFGQLSVERIAGPDGLDGPLDPHQDCDHRRADHSVRRVPDVLGTQDDRRHARARGPEPRGFQGVAATVCRRVQAVDEGSRRPQPGQQGAVRRGPRGHADARAGRLGRRALRS
ncbi:hypothetical protein G6F57_016757 [Rhizopus arrhizus]|nr:hypothetical protein G6F57_016757 [Rhizopus arrhizus]